MLVTYDERVIEMFSEKAAECYNCVYEHKHPVRRSFGRRLVLLPDHDL